VPPGIVDDASVQFGCEPCESAGSSSINQRISTWPIAAAYRVVELSTHGTLRSRIFHP